MSGSIKSSIGLGVLLLDGIGDTIRISLSDDPIREVQIGNEILKSLNLRERGVRIISCPSCARQGFQVIETVKVLEKKLSHIKKPVLAKCHIKYLIVFFTKMHLQSFFSIFR